MTINDMLEQNLSHNIAIFSIGDKIVRVERAPFKVRRYNENLGIEVEVVQHRDGSYLGTEMEYLGTYNRMICLRQIGGHLYGSDIIKLHIDQWGEGWQKYIIPVFDEKKG